MKRLASHSAFLAVFWLGMMSVPAWAQVQPITIVDGRTLIVDGVGVRLCGIVSPAQTDEERKTAGREMQAVIAGRKVMCVPVNSGSPCDGFMPKRTGGLYVAQCWAGKTDIALEMIRRGAARAVPDWSDGYYR